MEKVILKWKDSERTWCKDHWEYADGCSPLCKCLEITGSLSKAMDLCHQWRLENFTDEEIGYCCTNNQYEAKLEKEWIEDREELYRNKTITAGKKQ